MVDAEKDRTTITVPSELLARAEAAYEAHHNALLADSDRPDLAEWWRGLAATDRERAEAYQALAVELALFAPLMRACIAASLVSGDKADHNDHIADDIDSRPARGGGRR